MRLLFFFALIFVSFVAAAQDNIVQIDGTEIKCKVVEVSTESIKYKRFEDLDGPTYSILVSKVFIIQYENGTKGVFSAVGDTKKESQTFLIANIKIGVLPTEMNEYNSYYKNIGFLIGFGLEVGNVFSFLPKSSVRLFDVGLNITWLETSLIINHPSTLFAPYSASAGPQFSHKVNSNIALDFFLKPGVSIFHVNNDFVPFFLIKGGCTFRYKSLCIGLSGAFVPTIYSSYYNTETKSFSYDVPHNYSHIEVKIGAVIQNKKNVNKNKKQPKS